MRFHMWAVTLVVACSSLATQGVHAQATTGGSISGLVVTAETGKPIADAVIELVGETQNARTNGRGRFVIERLAAGDYVLSVRVIGFAPFRSSITVGDRQSAELAIRLPRVSTIDTLVVRAPASEPMAFLEARATGIGKFVTADELQAQRDRSLGDVLTMVQGVRVIHAGPRAYVSSTRKAPTLRAPPPYTRTGERSPPGQEFYYATRAEEARGIVSGCYARVYLDDQLLNPSSPAEPVNLNEYFARDLVGIEYYAGSASLPSRFARLNSTCGVVVLHTRKGP